VGIQHGADSKIGSINILNLVSKENRSFDLPGRPGFAFPTSQPNVFVAGVERSVGLFSILDGSWQEICSNVDSSVDNTIINDGLVYEDNLIFGCKELEFKTHKAGLYLWRGQDQKLIQLRSDQICSNGKAVLSDGDGKLKLIDIDSPSRTITSSDLCIKSGKSGAPEVIVDLTGEEVFPDGMILTPDGKSLIVALYDPGDPEAGEARQYSLADGTCQVVWKCPGSPRVTCPQLVQTGDGVCLVLTTAVEHMVAEQQARHPNAGCLFIGRTEFTDIGQQPKFPVP
jgi:sugar lactone lactonase YvrE